MIVENLKLNYDLIKNESFQSTIHWAIILSTKNFSKILKIDDYIKIYPLDAIDAEMDIDQGDSETLSPLVNKIKYLKQNNGHSGQFYYLLEAKIVSIHDERMRVPGSIIINYNYKY